MTKKRKTAIIITCIAIVLTLGFIWCNSLLDTEASAKESGFVYDGAMSVVEGVAGKPSADAVKSVITIEVFRDIAHAVEFFLLGVEFFVFV